MSSENIDMNVSFVDPNMFDAMIPVENVMVPDFSLQEMSEFMNESFYASEEEYTDDVSEQEEVVWRTGSVASVHDASLPIVAIDDSKSDEKKGEKVKTHQAKVAHQKRY